MTTPLGYRYLTDGISSPELSINQNFLIDDILARGVIAMDITTPPGSPADGDAYIVANDSTGVWADHDDQIAYWFDESGIWKFIIPAVGLRIYVEGEGADFRYLGGSSSWEVVAGSGTVTSVSGTGTVAGLTLTGTVTTSGNLTLAGTLAVPVANITPSTSDPIGVGSINLGHATDTTVTRVSAGVIAVEGVNIITTATLKPTECLALACSDETTALTTGTAKITFRMPYAFTLTAVRASVTTAPTGAILTVDINEAGSTILSTKLTIDASEKTSTTAATPAVISDSSLADDAEMTVDIDQVGSTIAGAGLKVYLIGTRT